ncbi:MAG: hypothetical protein GF344_10425 [Chitinivibrionales bacterium]|nr:hypothetical protein [Chitinivibrionales bacterium]MBD3357240.1 hypothetical protein [Chitinivibrionales bacterium]
MKGYIQILLVCLAIIGLRCGGSPLAGSGSQTTNSILVAVRDDSIKGRAEPGLAVDLFSADYDPLYDVGYRARVRAGEDSLFAFTGLDTNETYALLAVLDDSTCGVYLSGLSLGAGDGRSSQRKYAFSETESISGTVQNIPEGLPMSQVVVYLQATPFGARADTTGRFSIDFVPRAHYRVRADIVFDTMNPPYTGGPVSDDWFEVSTKEGPAEVVVELR